MKEGSKLDRTIAMSEKILGIGSMSSQMMQGQSEKLKKSGRNLKRIEKSAVPGLDRMVGMIKHLELRNRLIIAFVIALCLAIILYLQFASSLSIGSSSVTSSKPGPSILSTTTNT